MHGVLDCCALHFGKPPGGGLSHDGPLAAEGAAPAPEADDAADTTGFGLGFSGGGSGSPAK